jgi:glycosyltransferase involved in cell wall biosynthesis
MPKKKNILVLCNTFFYIYVLRGTLMKALIEEGFHITALAPDDEYKSRLEKMGVSCHNISLPSTAITPFCDLKYLISLYLFIKKNKPDAIMSFTIKPNVYGAIAAKVTEIPIICSVAGLGRMFCQDGLKKNLVLFLYRLVFAHVHKVVFQNDESTAVFVDEKIISQNQVLRTNGSGVNLQRFQPNGKTPGNKKFLFIGRLLKEKGIFHYIEAAKKINAKYPDAEFGIIGGCCQHIKEGATKSCMENVNNKYGISYLGTSDKMENIISEYDCVVLPSFYGEGVPKSLLEALAMGKPVITTDHPGCRDTFNGNNGYLCLPGNTNDLTDKISSYIETSPEERKKMGESSRRLAEEKFNEENCINIYIQNLNQLFMEKINPDK